MSNYKYKTGEDRTQIQLIQTSLDEMITSDDPVRAINKIIDEMNVHSLPFKYNEVRKSGQHSYNPSDMLKLYIFCLMHGVRSSRKIEAECHCNIKVMWLMRELKPDHKTISNFRKDNKEAIEEVFADFVLLCGSLGLLGKELVAIDGSKFRASNSKDKYFTLKKVEKKIEYHKRQIEKYMKMLDENDEEENKNPPLHLKEEDINKKVDEIKDRIKELEDLKKEVKEKCGIAKTDKDCKLMLMNNGGFNPAYNLQAAVDEKNKMVVAVDCTNAINDRQQLYSMAKQVKQNLEVDEITVVADAGYDSNQEMALCEKDGIVAIVSEVKLGRAFDKNYNKEHFTYDENNDEYICPQKQRLFLHTPNAEENQEKKYRNVAACKDCIVREKCTKLKYREIKDPPYENYARVVAKRTRENIEILKQRKSIIEHLFGTIKRNWGFDYFLTRGLENVATESYLYFLTYNFKRVISILGVEKILQLS